MSAVSLVASTHMRRNRRATVLLTLLLALAVAVALAALAGARRTDRVIGEFVAADRGADGYAAFTPEVFGGPATPDLAAEEEQIAAMEGVTATGRFTNAVAELRGPTLPGGKLIVTGWAAMEPGGLDRVSNFHLVAGRDLDDTKAGEILIDEELARDARLGLGSHVDLRPFDTAALLAGLAAELDGPPIDAEVVGIVRRPTDLRDPQEPQLLANEYTVFQDVYLTSALYEELGDDFGAFNPTVGFDIDDRADLDSILAALLADGAYAMEPARFLEIDGTFKGVSRSASLHSRGLQVFAAVVAFAGLFLVGQTLGRQVAAEAADHEPLRALGMTKFQLWGVALRRTAPVAVVGGFLGVVGAVALSPLTPLPGTVASRAELEPGIEVDPLVLLVGGLSAALLALLVAALPAARSIRSYRAPAARRDRPTLASRLAVRGPSVACTIGTRFALEPGQGRASVPVRTTLTTVVVAVALVVAATTFTASLDATRADPERFGVTWDIASGAMTDPAHAEAMADELRAMSGIRAFAAIGNTAFETTFGELPTVMARQEEGLVTPLITSGRAPRQGEVALGELTMREEGFALGDELVIDDPVAGTRSFVITGTAVLNVAGLDPSIAPGRGALFDWSILADLNPEAAEFIAPALFLVDVEPGQQAEVEEQLRTLFPTSTRAEPVEPHDLTNIGDASLLPTALGAVVTILGVGTAAHAMLSAVRRRRHELAVLKVMGFVRAETRRAVAWQAVILGTVALVIGIPIGIAMGRVSWSIAAGQLGIPSHPEVAPLAVLVVSAGFLLVLLLAAVLPAQIASRVPAAETLRAD